MKTWSRPQHLDTVILGCDWSERGDTELALVRRGPGPGSVLATATETSVTSFSMEPGDQQTCERCLIKRLDSSHSNSRAISLAFIILKRKLSEYLQ